MNHNLSLFFYQIYLLTNTFEWKQIIFRRHWTTGAGWLLASALCSNTVCRSLVVWSQISMESSPKSVHIFSAHTLNQKPVSDTVLLNFIHTLQFILAIPTERFESSIALRGRTPSRTRPNSRVYSLPHMEFVYVKTTFVHLTCHFVSTQRNCNIKTHTRRTKHVHSINVVRVAPKLNYMILIDWFPHNTKRSINLWNIFMCLDITTTTITIIWITPFDDHENIYGHKISYLRRGVCVY